jgi:hypothetical protein
VAQQHVTHPTLRATVGKWSCRRARVASQGSAAHGLSLTAATSSVRFGCVSGDKPWCESIVKSQEHYAPAWWLGKAAHRCEISKKNTPRSPCAAKSQAVGRIARKLDHASGRGTRAKRKLAELTSCTWATDLADHHELARWKCAHRSHHLTHDVVHQNLRAVVRRDGARDTTWVELLFRKTRHAASNKERRMRVPHDKLHGRDRVATASLKCCSAFQGMRKQANRGTVARCPQ